MASKPSAFSSRSWEQGSKRQYLRRDGSLPVPPSARKSDCNRVMSPLSIWAGGPSFRIRDLLSSHPTVGVPRPSRSLRSARPELVEGAGTRNAFSKWFVRKGGRDTLSIDGAYEHRQTVGRPANRIKCPIYRNWRESVVCQRGNDRGAIPANGNLRRENGPRGIALNLSAVKDEDSQATLRITTLTLAPEGSHRPHL